MNENAIVSITATNQNFSKATRLVETQGIAHIFKNKSIAKPPHTAYGNPDFFIKLQLSIITLFIVFPPRALSLFVKRTFLLYLLQMVIL
jgi:hypothetical protein